MENKLTYSRLTEYFSHYIAYRPELKKAFGKVTTAIFVNQIERWFSNNPTIFYKFLSPCVHPLYRNGDSWTEELEFSPAEFRTAFDAVGIRYRSKKQVMDLLNQENDPFQGKLYFSYMDVRQNLTYYIRNDAYADKFFYHIIHQFSPTRLIPVIMNEGKIHLRKEQLKKQRDTLIELIKKGRNPGSKLSSSPVLQKCISGDKENTVPEFTNCIPRDGESLSPKYEQNLQQEHTTEPSHTKTENYQVNKNSALGFYLNNSNENNLSDQAKQTNKSEICRDSSMIRFKHQSALGKIGIMLTLEQTMNLEERFERLYQEMHHKISSPDTLFEEIKYSLLDKTVFSYCQNYFHRKLCAIEKKIKEGRWQTPYQMQKTKPTQDRGNYIFSKTDFNQVKIHKTLQDLNKKIIEMEHCLQSDEVFLTQLSERDEDKELCEKIQGSNRKRRAQIQQLLEQRNNTISPLSSYTDDIKLHFKHLPMEH